MTSISATPLTRYARLADRARSAVEDNVAAVVSEHAGREAVAVQLEQLRGYPAALRRTTLSALGDYDVFELMLMSQVRYGTPYALWRDTPSGFAEDVLGEALFAQQRALLDATVTSPRVAAAMCFGSGKSHQVALLALWHRAVRAKDEGMTVVVVPHKTSCEDLHQILTMLSQANKVPYDHPAVYLTVPNDWRVLAGIHSPDTMIVVSDAGNLRPVQGKAVEQILSSSVRLVAVGTPNEEPGTWFEDLAQRSSTYAMRMSLLDLPSITGEACGQCRGCHDPRPHSPALHMADAQWAQRSIALYGYDHPKITARFPFETARSER
ncbi:hypothetical protein ACIP9H_34045 [Streptomyces sp. NPDC088732]|uniref:hypothetical protein n=1 Tax=Streptomyces sp. NPDC088732 TaxID=3365879 RepID=UPI003817E6E3